MGTNREPGSAAWGCGAIGRTIGSIRVWGGVVKGARPSLIGEKSLPNVWGRVAGQLSTRVKVSRVI